MQETLDMSPINQMCQANPWMWLIVVLIALLIWVSIFVGSALILGEPIKRKKKAK